MTKDEALSENAQLRAQIASMETAMHIQNERALVAEARVAELSAHTNGAHTNGAAISSIGTPEVIALLAQIEKHTNASTRALALIERAQTLQLQIASATFERTRTPDGGV